MFSTKNNYDIIKFSKKFWKDIDKNKYVDTGYEIYKIIKYIGNNFYICKIIEYIDFLNKFYKNILISSIEDTNNILISHNKQKEGFFIKRIPGGTFISNVIENIYTTKERIFYCEKTNSFYGPDTYYWRFCFFKLGYTFNKMSKKWEK